MRKSELGRKGLRALAARKRAWLALRSHPLLVLVVSIALVWPWAATPCGELAHRADSLVQCAIGVHERCTFEQRLRQYYVAHAPDELRAVIA